MTDPRHNHKFPSKELKKEAERRAEEEGRTLTAHINELLKQDARSHPSKADASKGGKKVKP